MIGEALKRNSVLLGSVSLLILGMVPVPAAYAQGQSGEQSAAPADDDDAQDAETSGAGTDGMITVTASRVNREGYSAPTATLVVGSEALDQRGATNVAAYLSEVPAFKNSTRPTTNGIGARSTGANYVDLRGLGEGRTLVLVDGNRFVPSISAGLANSQVDLNQVPALLVDRIEVVTGGASAQWGSDAVSGVVNVLLKRNFEGIQAEVQAGRSTHDDYGSFRFGFVAGTNFAGSRGNVTVAADFEENFGVGDVNERDWGREHWFYLANPCPNQVAVSAACPTGGNGQAANLILPDVQFARQTMGGLILNTALRGTDFGPGGVPQAFTFGQYAGATYMAGGGQPGVNFAKDQQISSPFKRLQTYGRVSYDLTDSVTAYLEASYAFSQGGGRGTGVPATFTIRNDNPYLPAATRTAMQQQGITNFSLGRFLGEFVSVGDLTNNTFRGVVGLEGTLPGAGNWRWSVAAGRGENKYVQHAPGAVITARAQFAADAVMSGGQIVCRATIPGPSFNAAAAGCIPMNVFGPNSGESARSYVTGTVEGSIDYTQTFANAEISGEPFGTWAGPVSMAVGAEYRRESQDSWADDISNAAGYNGNNSRTFQGEFNVKEAFAEVVVPLLKDSPIARSLELNGAIRYADYSGPAGGQTTWKTGVTYRPVEGLLLRAARSRDIRAANIFERNVPASSRGATITFKGVQSIVPALSVGNQNLLPEKADTLTFGAALQPAFAPSFAASLDYYDIDIKDVITTLSAQDVADLCGGANRLCELITFDANNAPTAITTPFLNLAAVQVSGIDGNLSYRLRLNDAGGALHFSLNGTYVLHSKVNSGRLGAPTIDRAGETGPKNQFSAARFRANASVTYSDDRLSLGVNARYVSAGNYDNTFTPLLINDNRIPSRTYINLSGSYELNPNVSFFAVVDNLFDTDPPPAPTENASPTNAVYFDTIGRVIKLGLRFKM